MKKRAIPQPSTLNLNTPAYATNPAGSSHVIVATAPALRFHLFFALVLMILAPLSLYSQVAALAPKVVFAGVQTSLGSGLNDPAGVAVDAAGNLFIADTENSRVLEISASGVASTVPATGLYLPWGVAVDANDDVYIADTYNSRVVEVSSSGVQTTIGSGFNDPRGVAVDASGDVFIADSGNSRVVEVSASGTQSTAVSSIGRPEVLHGTGHHERFNNRRRTSYPAAFRRIAKSAVDAHTGAHAHTAVAVINQRRFSHSFGSVFDRL